MSTTPNFSHYAEHFNIKESVISNMYEEYEMEMELLGGEYSFFDYLIEEFANAAFIHAAVDGGDIVDCLEAYDSAYEALADD